MEGNVAGKPFLKGTDVLDPLKVAYIKRKAFCLHFDAPIIDHESYLRLGEGESLEMGDRNDW